MTLADERPLGRLLADDGLVTEAQLETALRVQDASASYRPIGQILVDQKIITLRQLNHVLDKHRKRPRLGDILVRTKAISQARLQEALNHPRKPGVRLGELLVQLGLVTEEKIRQALCTQLNIPFVDLESLGSSPAHARWIKKAYAYQHRVVPIAQFVDSLTVAMDDPTDTSVIRELEYSTGSTINVVTSTSAGIRRAMRAVYGE